MIMQNYHQFMLGALQLNLSMAFKRQIRINFEMIIILVLSNINIGYI